MRALLAALLLALSFAALAPNAAAQSVPVAKVWAHRDVAEGERACFSMVLSSPVLKFTQMGFTVSTPSHTWGVGHVISIGRRSLTRCFNTEDDRLGPGGFHEYKFTLQAPGSHPGNNYRVGSPSSATVRVTDNDAGRVPKISISRNAAAVWEGETASFTVSASPIPAADLAVKLNVSEQTGGGRDFVASSDEGVRTVIFDTSPVRGYLDESRSTTFSVPTVDDNVEEPDGSVMVTVTPDTGYAVHATKSSAALTVRDDTGAPAAAFALSSQDVAESVGTVNVEVTLSQASSSDIVLKYTVGGYAKPGSDFTIAGSGSVTVPAGETSVDIPVTIHDDSRPEYVDTIELTLTNGGNAYRRGSRNRFTLYINDDDGTQVSFASASQSAPEDAGTVNVRVTLSRAAETDVVQYYAVGGTATLGSGSDFSAPVYRSTRDTAYGQVRVPAGETSVDIPVTIRDDDVAEGDETVVLTLTHHTLYSLGSQRVHTITIRDNDGLRTEPAKSAAQFRVGAASVEEGDVAVDVEVTLDAAAAQDVVIDWSASGTATFGTDYSLPGRSKQSGQVTVKAGSVKASIPVQIIDDAVEDDGETVVLTLTGIAGGDAVLGTAVTHTLTIDNDDAAPPQVSIAAGAGVTEGGTASFTLTASPAPTSPLAVSVTVAQSGDYAASGATGRKTVTIPKGGSVTFTVATVDDVADEADGSVTATVGAGQGYTVAGASSATVAVADNDAPPPATPSSCVTSDTALVALVAAKVTRHGTSGRTDLLEMFSRSHRTMLGTDTYTTADIKARPDKQGSNWQGAGPNPLWRSVYAELDRLETCRAGTTTEQPVTPGTPATPVVSIAGGSAVTEGGNASFTLTATPAPSSPLAVSVSVAQSGDYAASGATGTKTVTIPTTGSATWTVATVDDAVDEAAGSVAVTLAAGQGYTLHATANAATVAVADNDDPPAVPVVSIAGGSAVTEGGNASFTLTASPAPTSPLPVSVTVAQSGDYATSGTTGTKTVTIPTSGSATYTVATVDDAADEPDGSVTITLAAGQGYTVHGTANAATVAVSDDDDPPVTPVVRIGGGSAVTEGGEARFTLTATPAPQSAIGVSVDVTQSGDYAANGQAGRRTVSIGTGGTATFIVATVDDGTDEPDGSVTITLAAGQGYTLHGTANAATVAVSDDDLPPPEVGITAGSAVTEGGSASFTLTATPAPASPLTVSVTVAQSGDYAASGATGTKTVTIPASGSATYTVATVDDAADEPDGLVTVTLATGQGYTVASASAATVSVADNDDAGGAVTLSIADATANESDGVMWFEVRLSRPAAGEIVATAYSVQHQRSAAVSAREYLDFRPRYNVLRFAPGTTVRRASVELIDDNHDEDPETFEMRLRLNKGDVTIADGLAIGTIVNDDPMPAAWLARFGRTVAEQALDGIAGRMAAPRTPGAEGAIAGQTLSFDPAASGGTGENAGTPADRDTALAMAGVAQHFGGTGSAGFGGNGAGFGFGNGNAGFGDNSPAGQSRTMTAREALLGSSFSLTGQTDGAGGSMAFWGRAAQAHFDGREGSFSLDGEATTAMLGTDYARGNWLVGLALTQSGGKGGYADAGGGTVPRPASRDCRDDMDAVLCDGAVREGDGKVEASLTAAIPYAALQVSERLKLWGAAGHGSGEVTLKPAMGGSYRADTEWTMAAAGLRGDLMPAPEDGSGPALAVTSDALWARTTSEKTRDLAASESAVTRLRLGLEGSWRIATEGGGHVTPKLEVGARQDGGDAETGFGVELGGGLAWVDPGIGLSLDLSGRTLIAHGNDDLKDRGFAASLAFDPNPATQRGLSLNLRQELGGQAEGGLDALFAPDPLEDRTGIGETTSRWTMEAAYGFPAFGGRFTGSPHAGLGLSTGARDYSVGWRLAPEAATAPDVTFGLRATRRESDAAEPVHTVGFEIGARW